MYALCRPLLLQASHPSCGKEVSNWQTWDLNLGLHHPRTSLPATSFVVENSKLSKENSQGHLAGLEGRACDSWSQARAPRWIKHIVCNGPLNSNPAPFTTSYLRERSNAPPRPCTWLAVYLEFSHLSFEVKSYTAPFQKTDWRSVTWYGVMWRDRAGSLGPAGFMSGSTPVCVIRDRLGLDGAVSSVELSWGSSL